jgi:predicted dehydrogenase
MTTDPVRAALGRRLRLGVIGGGPGSFIGSVHRRAARRDDRYELVAGVLSSDPDRSQQAAVSIGIPEHRAYPSATAMIDAESARPDGIDVVAIMTPNDTHFEYSMAALAHGIDVICDKPMTNTVEEAEALAVAAEHSGLVFCLTHNYSGYPLVRQARAMVADGQLGTIRLVQVEYVQGGKADESRAVDPTSWKFDPVRGGPSRVMGDIGTHAHHLVRFVTGLEVTEVTADIGAIVPGRTIDDFAGALLRLDGGARGSFWVTQAAAGVENSLRIRVSGSRGSLEWQQEVPQRLLFTPLAGPAQRLTPNGPGTLPLSARSTRLVAGHPEGFPDSFATLYSDAAEAIAARRAGVRADPLALHFPDALDGLRGVRFVDAVIASSGADGAWTAP